MVAHIGWTGVNLRKPRQFLDLVASMIGPLGAQQSRKLPPPR